MVTNLTGNLSEAKILAAFLEAGYIVSQPFGDAHPYDFIVDDGRKLQRIQCKTGQLRSGAVVFWPKSNNGRWFKTGSCRGYAETVDIIAVYCPETNRVYNVSAAETKPTGMQLRVEPPANNQAIGIRWAKDYELKPCK